MRLPSLSVVVPLYNEEDNVLPLMEALQAALTPYSGDWHVILVDDGSTDETPQRVTALQPRFGDRFSSVQLQRNFGQTAAMQAGIDTAKTELIATMDGDLQNDPDDIPRMVEELLSRDLDLLQGWRKNRKDAAVSRKLPSRIANKIIQRVSGVLLNDYGCSLKIYRADVIKQVRLYGEMHRFIPIWMATVCPPHRIGETVVNHRARMAGVSKYGISRTFRVLLDLLTVFFFLKFRARPGHFFGALGLWLGVIGGVLMVHLLGVKIFMGEDIGGRPMLMFASLLLIASMQFLTTGVVSEILSRIFFQTTNVHSYKVRKPLDYDMSTAGVEVSAEDSELQTTDNPATRS